MARTSPSAGGAPLTMPAPPATVTFDVYGIPAPQGSTRAFVVNGHAVTTNKGGKPAIAWRDSVAAMAHELAGEHGCLAGPLTLNVAFRFPMPKSRPKATRVAGACPKTTAPDLDKLVRSVCDALQAGGLIVDDARVTELHAVKLEVVGWTGATVEVSRWRP